VTVQAYVKTTNESMKVVAGEFGSQKLFLRALEKKETDLLEVNSIIQNAESELRTRAVGDLRHAQELLDAGQLNSAQSMLIPLLKIGPDLWPNSDEAQKLRKEIAAKIGSAPPPNPEFASAPVPADGKLSLIDLNDRLNALHDRYAGMKDELKSLHERAEKMHIISQSKELYERDLAVIVEAEHRLDFEGIPQSGIDVISSGDMPLHPDHDRRLTLALTSGSAITVTGISFILIFKFIRRRRNEWTAPTN
jgi:hypothetical protein